MMKKPISILNRGLNLLENERTLKLNLIPDSLIEALLLIITPFVLVAPLLVYYMYYSMTPFGKCIGDEPAMAAEEEKFCTHDCHPS